VAVPKSAANTTTNAPTTPPAFTTPLPGGGIDVYDGGCVV